MCPYADDNLSQGGAATSLHAKPCLLLAGLLLSLSACAAQKAADTPPAPNAPAIETPAPPQPIVAPAAGAVACSKTALFSVGEAKVWQIPGKPGFFFLVGMAIDADGAPDAYHPSDIGRDFLANAGRPGNWWALVTDTGRPDGAPVIQGAADPNPGFYVSATALQDRTKALRDPMRYVDSNTVPYFVLPSNQRGGARLGNFGVALNRRNGKLAYMIFADLGPTGKIGEGSIALAERLGLPSNPRRGGASRGIVYVVFPGSGNGRPRSLDEIEREASVLFEGWGGMAQLDACLP